MRNLNVLCLILLAAALTAPAHARHAYGPAIDVEVVSPYGRPFNSYPLREDRERDVTRAYLEAVPGKAYAVRVTNRTGERVGLVIAVDGRNIISGKKSKLRRKERMYVLGPWETATYRGWRTGRDRVNEFYFTTELDSYAGAFGDFSAMGVVAVAAFRDRHAPSPLEYRHEKERRYDGHGDGRAPSAESQAGRAHKSAPGTGYGDERHSPSRRVHFEAERHAFAKTFIKYEWRESLCEMGIARCRNARHERHNRFWPRQAYRDRGYAPPPPGYRQHRSRDDYARAWRLH